MGTFDYREALSITDVFIVLNINLHRNDRLTKSKENQLIVVCFFFCQRTKQRKTYVVQCLAFSPFFSLPRKLSFDCISHRLET